MSNITTTCRKSFCDNKNMEGGNYDRSMVGAMDGMFSRTTDWTLCHSCNYWLAISGRTGVIRITGDVWEHYTVRSSDSPMKGFDGREHTLTVTSHEGNEGKVKSGLTFITDNLWRNGIIPAAYHKLMITSPSTVFVDVKTSW